MAEVQRDHWRQTAPATGTRAVTVVSGQHLTDADFGNVCLGNVEAKVPAGVQVRLEEVNVPGILANSPALPRTATGESTLKDLLPGTYKITMLLPDDVFVTDPDLTAVDGHLAVVRTITVTNCATTEVILTPAPRSADGKVTGVGLKLPVAPKFVTSGFVFMQTGGVARGNLQVNDHAGKLVMHTADIQQVAVVSPTLAYVYGRVVLDGTTYSFRLELHDNGEPGRADVYDLRVGNGYAIGQGQTIGAGNIQIH